MCTCTRARAHTRTRTRARAHKMQLEPERYNGSVLEVGASIVSTDGVGALTLGAGPTLIGYAVQGALKYGFYEVLKPVLAASVLAGEPRLVVLLTAGVVRPDLT